MADDSNLYNGDKFALSSAYADAKISASSRYQSRSASSRLALQPLFRSADVLIGCVALILSAPLIFLIFLFIKSEGSGTGLVLRKLRNQFGERAVAVRFRTRHSETRKLSRVGMFLNQTHLSRLPLFYLLLSGDLTLFGKNSLFTQYRDNYIGFSDGELPLNIYAKLFKYPVDIAFVILASPAILLIVAVLYIIVRKDGGPGFFGQLRVGKNGKEFRCWKIRSMQINSAEILEQHLARNPTAAKEWEENRKLSNDPRITKIGKVFRKLSLDEFPQFWNVMKGEMSLVGPRPVPRDELLKYGTYDAYYKAVKPGVTGLWQVSGRNDVSYDERVALDVTYTQTLSMTGDIMIILKTVTAMLKRTGN